ncbi:MAG TPA: hemerythrin domain-containing protein [Polyangia bacterium]|nr:hemerythrin domain-containing protein [Polyangia bacterium]
MPTLVFPSNVRDAVLQQHAELRELLRATADELARPAESGAEAQARLRAMGRELCARFHEHLLYEDEELVPVLAVLDSWGPERVRALHDEHARQRRTLGALWMTFDFAADLDQLGAALRVLSEDMLRDMDEEEAGCLALEAMAAPLLHVERT